MKIPGCCVLSALLLVGCSDLLVDPPPTAASSTSTSGVGGAGGGAGSTSGVGGGVCGAAQLDPASFTLTLDASPAMTPPTDTTVEGKVIASAPGTVTIDTCAPDANCTAVLATLVVTAPNLPAVLVPPGAWVRLRLHVEPTANGVSGGGLSSQVLIENLPDWMGSPNPLSTTSRVWFAAFTSGNSVVGSPPSFVPFTVAEVPCGSCWSPPSDVENLTVTFPGAAPTLVPTGEQRAFDVTGSLAAHYVFQGLHAERSCESYGLVSYWLTGS
jgi:hypothetical protein